MPMTRSPSRSGTQQVAGEDLARPPRVVGMDERRELTTDLVADDAAGSLVQPAHHARVVDHVARHVDVLERAFEVPAQRA